MVESLFIDDPAERFQLPQIRETVKGLLDAISVFVPGFPPPSDHEVETIAKPAATMLARKPQVQNVVKKYAAPAVFAGAVGGYFSVRLTGRIQRAAQRDALIAAQARLSQVQAQTPQDAAPAMAPESIASPSPAQAQEPRPSPAMAAALAQHAQSIIDAQRAAIRN